MILSSTDNNFRISVTCVLGGSGWVSAAFGEVRGGERFHLACVRIF